MTSASITPGCAHLSWIAWRPTGLSWTHTTCNTPCPKNSNKETNHKTTYAHTPMHTHTQANTRAYTQSHSFTYIHMNASTVSTCTHTQLIIIPHLNPAGSLVAVGRLFPIAIRCWRFSPCFDTTAALELHTGYSNLTSPTRLSLTNIHSLIHSNTCAQGTACTHPSRSPLPEVQKHSLTHAHVNSSHTHMLHNDLLPCMRKTNDWFFPLVKCGVAW